MENQMNKKESFFATSTGRYVIIGICCVVIWGIALTLWMYSSASPVVIIICAVFGWKALNKIQPSMFVWMPWGGWLIYVIVKFVLSAFIGLFVAPFVIGNMIGNAIHGEVSSR